MITSNNEPRNDAAMAYIGAALAIASRNEYIENGYKNRRDYLISLAEEYDVPKSVVFSLAQMLGPSEDFDGLVTALDSCEDWDL